MNIENDFADDGEFDDEAEALDLTPEMEADDDASDEAGDDDSVDQPDDNAVIRQMRKELRDAKREARRLREKQPEAAPVDVGPRPRLEDFDYDEDKHGVAVDAWNEKRIEAKLAAQREQEASTAPIRQDWEADLNRFKTEAETLKAKPDARAALEEVEDTLNAVQQMCIIKAAKSPATVLYMLGKDPDTLDRIADMSDPIKIAAEITRFEMEAGMSAKSKPAVDAPVKGRAASVTTSSKALDRLKQKAQETGDYTAYFAAKRARAA